MTITIQKLTFEEYLTDDGTDTRHKLVDGELVSMRLGTGKHASIAEFLHAQFCDQIKQKGLPWTCKQMTVGVHSPRGRSWDTFRIPDVTILSLAQWEEMAEQEAVINFNETHPFLVVEVVSLSTQTDDYRSKRAEYGLLEIPEYWIVNPIAQKITLCVLDHKFYNSTEFRSNDLIVSPTFPALTLTTAQVLASKL